MKQKNVSFPCGKINLEGSLYLPDTDRALPAVVLCHPHPLYGGSMDNNVIHAISAVLILRSIIAFMFNFRGVGNSGGSFGGGIDEQEDVTAAITYLASQPDVDASNIGLVGYSFGAIAAAPVVGDDKRLKAIALISPPLDDSQLSRLKKSTKPKLIICGGRDMFVPPEQVESLHKELAEPKQMEIIPKADHFWWGQELELAEKVGTFFHTSFAQH